MRLVADAGVGSVPVVVMQPPREGLGALDGAFMGTGVGPFPKGGLDQSFGFAIGSRAVGARSLVDKP